MTPDLPSPPVQDDYTPWRKLAAAIIEQAVWDYRSVVEQGGLGVVRARCRRHKTTGRAAGPTDAESAVHFFTTSAYENLCLFVRVDAEGIRDRLAQEALAHGVTL